MGQARYRLQKVRGLQRKSASQSHFSNSLSKKPMHFFAATYAYNLGVDRRLNV
jgi:hypothetical protein